MMICEGIETGKRYFWKRSKGWDWDGKECWWVWDVEVSGFNGGGGLWIIEHSRWNTSAPDYSQFTKPDTLSCEDSEELIKVLLSNVKRGIIGSNAEMPDETVEEVAA